MAVVGAHSYAELQCDREAFHSCGQTRRGVNRGVRLKTVATGLGRSSRARGRRLEGGDFTHLGNRANAMAVTRRFQYRRQHIGPDRRAKLVVHPPPDQPVRTESRTVVRRIDSETTRTTEI